MVSPLFLALAGRPKDQWPAWSLCSSYSAYRSQATASLPSCKPGGSSACQSQCCGSWSAWRFWSLPAKTALNFWWLSIVSPDCESWCARGWSNRCEIPTQPQFISRLELPVVGLVFRRLPASFGASPESQDGSYCSCNFLFYNKTILEKNLPSTRNIFFLLIMNNCIQGSYHGYSKKYDSILKRNWIVTKHLANLIGTENGRGMV